MYVHICSVYLPRTWPSFKCRICDIEIINYHRVILITEDVTTESDVIFMKEQITETYYIDITVIYAVTITAILLHTYKKKKQDQHNTSSYRVQTRTVST